MRERGYPPEAIKDFCSRIGVAKSNSEVDAALLEHCVREYLNLRATRVMVVKNPIKLVIDNYEGKELLDIDNNPMDEAAGTRKVCFGNTLYIDAEDFSENPPSNYYRLKPGGTVRLKGAYIIKYVSHIKDAEGNTEVHCELIEDSKSGGVNAGMKVKATIHWVDAATAVNVTVNEYDYLLDDVNDGRDFSERLNRSSKKVLTGAKAEATLKNTAPYTHYQFMRCGYYMTSGKSTADDIIFNMVVGLKDSYKPN
jgi:glutaminyl-tRNA synthetase